MQKRLCLMLALLCVAVLGVWADGVGTFGGGDGSAKNPYIINTTAHWDQLATDVNGGNAYSDTYFLLDADLTVTTMVGTGTTGNNAKSFSGTFDGGDHTLTFNYDGSGDHIAALADGNPHDIVLQGRTLYKDGNWNTLCLPFTLTVSKVNAYLNYPTGLMTLSSSIFDSEKGILTLNFSDELENGIKAGKPYIIKWSKPNGYDGHESNYDITDPYFSNVIVTSGTTATVTDYVKFCGTFSSIDYAAADQSILFLGTDNTLYYPKAGAHIGAFRAYFHLDGGLTCGEPNSPNAVRAFNLCFGNGEEDTGIKEVKSEGVRSEKWADAWYDLNGRRLSGKPTQKGLYIHGGRKVVIP